MAHSPKTPLDQFKNKLNDVDFLEEHSDRIVGFVETHKDNVSRWKQDILQVLDITGMNKKDAWHHSHEIANLIREKCKQLDIFIKQHPQKMENPLLQKGYNVYKALAEYTYAVEKHNAGIILKNVSLLNKVAKQTERAKKQAIELNEDRANNLKDFIFNAFKEYDDAFKPANKDKIKDKLSSLLNWRTLTKGRMTELLQKLELQPHSPKDEIDGIDWGYIWVQIAIAKQPENEALKRVKRQLDEGTYTKSSINVVGKIDLPTQPEKKNVPTTMQEQTINPDEYIGKTMPMKQFLAKLSLPEGYQSVDQAIEMKEKGFGIIQNISHNRVFITLGLAEDSKEPLDKDHPKFITVLMPKHLIPADKLQKDMVIPLAFIEKTKFIPSSDKEGGSHPKYYIRAEYYNEQKHGQMGAIGKALQKVKETK